MAFRMVESTIRRIMGGLEERRGDEIVFAGLLKSGDAVSMVLNSHNSSKFFSTIPPQSPSFAPSSPPQSPCSYSSSAPLLDQSSSAHQQLEGPSSQESPRAVSSRFAPPCVTRHNISLPEYHLHTAAISHRQQQQLASSEPTCLPVTAEPPDWDHGRPNSRARAEGECSLSKLFALWPLT